MTSRVGLYQLYPSSSKEPRHSNRLVSAVPTRESRDGRQPRRKKINRRLKIRLVNRLRNSVDLAGSNHDCGRVHPQIAQIINVTHVEADLVHVGGDHHPYGRFAFLR